MTTTPIKVFIADDHRAIIDGVQKGITNEPDLQFAGSACHEEELLTRISGRVDVLLLDIFSDKKNFLSLIGQLLEKHPNICIIILSGGNYDLVFAKEIIEKGARGFISKVLGMQDICNAIRRVFRHPDINIIELPNPNPDGSEGQLVKETLTARELQVISLLCKGFPNNKELAEFLAKINKADSISEHTIATHRKNIRRKLKEFGVTNDTSLGYWTAKWDLLDGTELSSTPDE